MAAKSEKPKGIKAPDLSALINREQEDSKKEQKFLAAIKTTARRKKIAIISGLSVAIVLVFGALIVYDPFTASLRWGTPGQNQVDIGADPGNGGSGFAGPLEWWEDPETRFPVDVPEWQRVVYNPENRATLQQSAYELYYGTSVGMSASGLPSESTGFTSDLDERFLEDGSQNPRFSYWTNEVFTAEVGLMLERLTKPSLGGWEAAQFGRDPYIGQLDDLFTEKAVTEMRNEPARYPILIETYGENLLASGTRWVGEVQSFTMTLRFNSFTGQYSGDAKVDILYTAWTEDRTQVTKNATLNLTLVSNAGNAGNGSSNRVLIDSSSLVVS